MWIRDVFFVPFRLETISRKILRLLYGWFSKFEHACENSDDFFYIHFGHAALICPANVNFQSISCIAFGVQSFGAQFETLENPNDIYKSFFFVSFSLHWNNCCIYVRFVCKMLGDAMRNRSEYLAWPKNPLYCWCIKDDNVARGIK